MSQNYRYMVACPGCGLDVAAKASGILRPHQRRALREAPGSECALGKEAFEAHELQRRQPQSSQELWRHRDPDTKLPKQFR